MEARNNEDFALDSINNNAYFDFDFVQNDPEDVDPEIDIGDAPNTTAPTYRSLFFHELNSFMEMYLINLVCAVLIWGMDYNYEMYLLALPLVVVRSKSADNHTFPDDLSILRRLFRLAMAIAFFYLHVGIYTNCFHYFGSVKVGKYERLADYKFQSGFAECTYIASVYTTVAFIIRTFIQLAAIIGNCMDYFGEVNQLFVAQTSHVGPGGDVPSEITMADAPPTSFSYPSVCTRRARHFHA